MARRRAVSAEDRAAHPEKLPLLYKTLVPLAPERHSALRIRSGRDFQVASGVSAIPLTIDEFPRAMRDFVIVIAPGATPAPVALVGFEQGRNEYVNREGEWRENTYVPAWLRRFPFALLKESEASDRRILCADLSSTIFTEAQDEGEPLFAGDEPADPIRRALDFCKRFDEAMARTRAVMDDAMELGLIGPASVTIEKAGARRTVEGFSTVNEEKLRALDDETLAGLARRGVLNMFAAHHMSLANFSAFGSG